MYVIECRHPTRSGRCQTYAANAGFHSGGGKACKSLEGGIQAVGVDMILAALSNSAILARTSDVHQLSKMR